MITAVEVDPGESQKIKECCYSDVDVINNDFFTWFRKNANNKGSFDAVIGNPPFIRYHDFPEEHRQPAFALMRDEGLHPSRLTNAWLPFIVAATSALREGGRLAFVLPAELLQVMYASELREYLARNYSKLVLITFKKLIFPGIQEETILLLGVKGQNCIAEISFVELEGIPQLENTITETVEPVELDLDHAREKWTQYYLTPKELGLIRQIEASSCFRPIRDYALVDVGIVTGRNQFFVLTKEQAESLGLIESCLPMIGRSVQIPGVVLQAEQWEKQAVSNGRCYLLQLGAVPRDLLTKSALSYVEQGEAQGFHQGYKCAIRSPMWWNVPSVWAPDGFLLRQIHDGPRIIANKAAATCTDTIHRVRTLPGTNLEWLATTSMNSLTYAFAEIRGRSYGGGVLELEPTEAEGLLVPEYRMDLPILSLEEFDNLTRSHGVEAALDEIDRSVLREIGLSRDDLVTLRGIWHRLYIRRKSRKKVPL